MLLLGVGRALGRLVRRRRRTRRCASTSSTTPCPAGVRRAFTIVSCLALVVLMALSLPATWHYVAFMRRERSAYLGMRFDFLYSIYVLFARRLHRAPAAGGVARLARRACRRGER